MSEVSVGTGGATNTAGAQECDPPRRKIDSDISGEAGAAQLEIGFVERTPRRRIYVHRRRDAGGEVVVLQQYALRPDRDQFQRQGKALIIASADVERLASLLTAAPGAGNSAPSVYDELDNLRNACGDLEERHAQDQFELILARRELRDLRYRLQSLGVAR